MADLKQQLRLDFNNYIRNKLIRDECQDCGSNLNLHLHHESEHFASILNNVLDYLGLNYSPNIEDYNENELIILRDAMLGYQTRMTYRTLCSECHREVHLKEGKDWSNFYLHYERKRKGKEELLAKLADDELIPYLEFLYDNEVRIVTKEKYMKSKKFIYENRSKFIDTYRKCTLDKVSKTIKTINNTLTIQGINYFIKGRRSGGIKYWTVHKKYNE